MLCCFVRDFLDVLNGENKFDLMQTVSRGSVMENYEDVNTLLHTRLL